MDGLEAGRIILDSGFDISSDTRSIVEIATEIVVKDAMGEAFSETYEDPEVFSQFIASSIANLGLTSRQLGDLVGTSATTVERWNEGISWPTDPVRRRVIVHLGYLQIKSSQEE